MGIKRIVDTSFWTDNKVDDFSPEDKYFMLYLLTNPFTTQLGIYEISMKQVAFQLGYSKDAVMALIERFERYGIIIFSNKTNEIAIKNFLKHSIVKGGAPVRDCLIKEMKTVKDKELINRVFAHIKGYEKLNETVKRIIQEYEEKNGTLSYSNEKDNENDNENDNEVSYHDTDDESSNDSLVKKPSKAEIDAFFESVWDLYPVKKGKGQVSDTKRKKLYDIGFDELYRAIDRYIKELDRDSAWRKPQNGSTFFNSGYVDYLDDNFVPDAQKTQQRNTSYTEAIRSRVSDVDNW